MLVYQKMPQKFIFKMHFYLFYTGISDKQEMYYIHILNILEDNKLFLSIVISIIII